MGKEFSVNAREETINCHGLDFLCIYGRHINGGYAALMNWGVAVELSASKNDLRYNQSKIREGFERVPSHLTCYLPSDTDERTGLARDLAMMIMSRLSELPELPKP